jgi:hypothetical protein
MPLLTIGGARDRQTVAIALEQLVATFDSAKSQADALAQATMGLTAADLVLAWPNTTTAEAQTILDAIAAFETMVSSADSTTVGKYAAQIRSLVR